MFAVPLVAQLCVQFFVHFVRWKCASTVHFTWRGSLNLVGSWKPNGTSVSALLWRLANLSNGAQVAVREIMAKMSLNLFRFCFDCTISAYLIKKEMKMPQRWVTIQKIRWDKLSAMVGASYLPKGCSIWLLKLILSQKWSCRVGKYDTSIV